MEREGKEMLNQVDNIIAYEQGELDQSDTLAMFAELVKSGLAWQLQGHYGRTAARLIETGFLSKNGEILRDCGEE